MKYSTLPLVSKFLAFIFLIACLKICVIYNFLSLGIFFWGGGEGRERGGWMSYSYETHLLWFFFPFPFLPNLWSRFSSANVYMILRQYFQNFEVARSTCGALPHKISFQSGRLLYFFYFFFKCIRRNLLFLYRLSELYTISADMSDLSTCITGDASCLRWSFQ